MALVKCKECGSQVSTKAGACPGCGAKVKQSGGCGILLAVVFAIFALATCFSSMHLPNNQTAATALVAPSESELSAAEREQIRIEAQSRAAAALETETIIKAERAVRSRMKDPTSAVFKDVRYGKSDATGAVAYGYVNSKNSFGGFQGFQRFISNGTTTLLEEENNRLRQAWAQLEAAKP